MESDDPRTPLLGHTQPSRLRRAATKLCGLESWKRRFPITIWLPKYKYQYLIKDMIAGITVGLTSIPQGIAYAIIAGMPPQVGLYSSIFPGLVYILFGSCKDVIVGPTAILSALIAKYVAVSPDFAYLAAFLSGCVMLLLGVLQLGFLLDLISKPVISGFTTAAALQIGASQFKSLFRLKGSSGNTFISALANFIRNIKSVNVWDTVLGFVTIASLLLLKQAKLKTRENDSRSRKVTSSIIEYTVRARNALVVFAACILAYCFYVYGDEPFALTGTIHGGLPDFSPPPFSTVVNNQTLNFEDMLKVIGPEGFIMPLVAILETIAIAKAFAGDSPVDATQEMIAMGAANMLSSFTQCMPTTGSFTRTALNHASGVVTPASSFFKAMLVLLTVTLVAPAFYFIPRATLAGVILVAMMSIIELRIAVKLWKCSKTELFVFLITVVTGACLGLEYGILVGAGVDAVRALATVARPSLKPDVFKIGSKDCLSVPLVGTLSYSSAEYIPRRLRRYATESPVVFILDGRFLYSVDVGVAENLVSVILELELKGYRFLLWNFPEDVQAMLVYLRPGFESKFVSGPSIDQHVLDIDIIQRNNTELSNIF